MDELPSSAQTFVDPLEHVLGYQLRRASIAVMSNVAAELAPLGLTPGQASLIVRVGANPGCTQSAIGRALRAKAANLVPLLNQLAALGLLDRKPGAGRTIALTLSALGLEVLVAVQAALARAEDRLAQGFSPEQRALAIATMKQICHNACADCDGKEI